MKEKTKSIIFLFFISLILIPSFIYGASTNQKTIEQERKAHVLDHIVATPKDVHIPRGSDEKELRDMIEVEAYYKGVKEPKIITDYVTNYKTQKDKKGKRNVMIQYTENGCTKKTCVTVTFCKPMQSEEAATPTPSVMPTESPTDDDINFPYISGYTDDTFKPNQAVTREEMATMLARLITKNRIPIETNQYDDLHEGRFSTDASNYITKLDVMKPKTAKTFDPNGPISYDEFREIVSRLMPYIKNANVTLLSGSGNLTRAQAVVALNRLFNVQCNTSYTSSPFTDVSETNPNYDDILCATQTRIQPRS